jgi:hypothetical protein
MAFNLENMGSWKCKVLQKKRSTPAFAWKFWFRILAPLGFSARWKQANSRVGKEKRKCFN